MAPGASDEYPAGLGEWIRDGKTWGPTRDSRFGDVFVMFWVGLVSPLWGLLIMPLALILHGIRLAMTTLPKRTKPADADDTVTPEPDTKPLAGRKYDVVLFGATGFTGTLAAEYVAKTYGGSTGAVKWAVAGRRRDALETLVRSLGPAVDIIVADVSNEASLHAVVKDTRCVVNMAGPFSRYATPVVKHCVSYGTHYVDITGEIDWVREMIDRFDGKCQKTKSRVVHCCGHDSVPWDMTTHAVAQHLRKEHNQGLASIFFADRLVAAPSGGTLESIMTVLFPKDKYTASLKHDPLVDKRGERSAARFMNKCVRTIEFAPDGAPCTFFVMAEANAQVVKRSNALLHYGDRVRYAEGEAAASLFTAFARVVKGVAAVAWLACPPVLALARKYVFPPPGKGPSRKFMKEGFLHVTAFAHGDDGAKVKAVMYLRDDPGYRDTARMVVEAGLTLALAPEAEIGAPGVVTPAAGMGDAYMARLKATGTGFAFHPWEPKKKQ